MEDARIEKAVGRIEAALARIERANASTSANPGNAELVARHEALRESVSASLADLDRLIERIEG